MAIAHSCHVCGHSLTRVWAPLDPIYKLPIVVCPSCTTACVRRRPVIRDAWRRGWRVVNAVANLVGRSILGFVLVACTFGAASLLTDAMHNIGPLELVWKLALGRHEATSEPLLVDYGPWVVGSFALWFVLLGVLVSAGLSHLSRARVWTMFLGAVAAFFVALMVIGVVSDLGNGSTSLWSSVRTTWNDGGPSLELVVLGMPLTLLGVAPGRRLRRALDRGQARRWKKRLARRRRARMAQ